MISHNSALHSLEPPAPVSAHARLCDSHLATPPAIRKPKGQDHPRKTALRTFLRAFWQLFSVFDDLDHAELCRISISAGQRLAAYRPLLIEGSKRAKNRRKTKIIAKATRNKCANSFWRHSEPATIALAGMSRPARSPSWLHRGRCDRSIARFAVMPRPMRSPSQSRRARIVRRADRVAAASRSNPSYFGDLSAPHACLPKLTKQERGFSELNPLISG